MSENTQTAIVGNGGAAVYAVQALRNSGYEGSIHLFSDTIWPPFNPMLTTYYAAGKLPLENCFPFGIGFDFYEENGVNPHLGSPVVELDAEKQTIKTENGESFEYDQCLVATGASCIVPPIPGSDSDKLFTMRTVQDAVGLRKAIEKNPDRIVVVGGSMVGIKIVELCHKEGIDVCIADMADHVFPFAAHPNCAELIEDKLEEKGIKLRMGGAITEIEETEDDTVLAHFDDEEEPEEADLVAMCVGVKSNMDFLDPDQVNMDRGILVDEHMQTNVSNLYAAGDVTQSKNMLTGEKDVIGLWANALKQGRCAGRNMAGVEEEFPGNIPYNITHFMDMVFVGIGNAQDDEHDRVYEKKEDGDKYCRLVWDGDKLVGVNLLNHFTSAGILKQFIKKQLVSKAEVEKNFLLQALLQKSLNTKNFAKQLATEEI